MSKHKKRKDPKYKEEKQKQTAWEVIKDLFKNPFEYRRKHTKKGFSRFMAAFCIVAAVCMLFYMSGHM